MILENLYRDFISKMERRNEKIYNVKVLIKVKLINFFFLNRIELDRPLRSQFTFNSSFVFQVGYRFSISTRG